ncbi:hypothetical protein, partial [Staphylococcus succinus]|uniref:hypothetical protein n=1 Tax=Staphylococcus succinus TaxID=61015 RepID=UPI001C710DCB
PLDILFSLSAFFVSSMIYLIALIDIYHRYFPKHFLSNNLLIFVELPINRKRVCLFFFYTVILTPFQ